MQPAFVRAEGTQFMLEGKPLRLVGANCYYLAYCSDMMRDNVFRVARDMHLNALRVWAFRDTDQPAREGAVSFQANGVPQDGPNGLALLDRTIAAAERENVRLILPLSNYWHDFGGFEMYLKWAGIPGQVDQFYTRGETRVAYQHWAEAVLTRRNTVTGRLYRDEPAILAWELANEARCPVGGRETLLEWAATMSSFLKGRDPNHLVALGDEGWFGDNGVDFDATLAIPGIDFGTHHFYPRNWGRPESSGFDWIADHLQSGVTAGKPAIMEEYGLGPAPGRNEWYARWLDEIYMSDGAGDLLWMIASTDEQGNRFKDADEFTIFSAAEAPAVGEHAQRMVLNTL